MNFCTKCGNRLEPELKFCTRCGTPVPAASGNSEGLEIPAQADVPVPAEEPAGALSVPGDPAPRPALVDAPRTPPATAWTSSPAIVPQQQSAAAKSSCLPALLIGLAVIALIAVAVVGGTVYVGYQVKKKATAMLNRVEPQTESLSMRLSDLRSPSGNVGDKPSTPAGDSPNGAAGLLDGLPNMLNGSPEDRGDQVQTVSNRDHVDPCSPAPYSDQTAARVPLQENTVITTSWGIVYEDVESHIAVREVTPSSIELSSNTGDFKTDDGGVQAAASYQNTTCKADLANGNEYITENGTYIPHILHGVTRLRLSDRYFSEIKSTGRFSIDYLSFLTLGDVEAPYHDVGVLTRVEPEDVPYPMIVNDERGTLPAIHLTGITETVGKDPRRKKDRPLHSQAEMYVIDDPLDPLVLLWRVKDPVYHNGKFRIEVVKIDYKTLHPMNIVEKQLTELKRAVTYGIYFDFNKDTIKPESEKVLKEIVQAMTDNPTWKLTVEGHTDNIGGDAYNLDLSKRRAAAVKEALVTRYHIAADRLTTDGYGASRPVETNDTLEGRARNRRVELARE